MALVIDNCSAHSYHLQLSFCYHQYHFETPAIGSGNKTLSKSLLHIFKILKTNLPIFSILRAVKVLDFPWLKVNNSTIINNFAKIAGIPKEKQKSAQLDDDDSLKNFKIKSKSLPIFNLMAQQLKMLFQHKKI